MCVEILKFQSNMLNEIWNSYENIKFEMKHKSQRFCILETKYFIIQMNILSCI